MARRSRDDEFGGAPLPRYLCSDDDLATVETHNLGELSEFAIGLGDCWKGTYHFTPEIIKHCHRLAMTGIFADAGEYRTRFVHVDDFIGVPHREIPRLVDQMCEYVNRMFDDPFHAAAYILWRASWIHPFYDGNGRVSRTLCYLALNVGLELQESPVPISYHLKMVLDRYLAGLRAADVSDDDHRRVKVLEDLLCELTTESSASDLSGKSPPRT